MPEIPRNSLHKVFETAEFNLGIFAKELGEYRQKNQIL